MSGSTTASPMTPAINYQQRMALLASNQPQRTRLGSFPTTPGNTLRVTPNNTGITTGFLVKVTATLQNTAASTATLVLGPRAPYAVLTNINFKDYWNTSRVNVTGQQLQIINTERRNAIRQKRSHGYWGNANSAGSMFAGGSANVFGMPQVPTSIPATSSANLTFFTYVPLAYGETSGPDGDLRGAILSQTSIGNMQLSLQFQNSLWGPNSIYTGTQPATMNVLNLTVTVDQDWLSPQPVGGRYPNPAIDLATVYELNGAIIDQTNLTAGQSKFINYPNVRSVLGVYLEYADPEGTYLAGTDVDNLQLVVNSNNYMQFFDPVTKAMQDRDILGSDMAPGAYVMRSRSVPIQTALMGNYQIIFTPSAVAAGAFLWEAFESFYPLGAVMPGVAAP